MNILKGFVALIAMGISGLAVADLEVYAGGSIGSADASAKPGNIQSALVAKGYDITGVSVDSSDNGWRFLAGLRFTDMFAVELGYVDLGESTTKVDGNIIPTQTAQFNQDVANLLPVMPRGMTLAGVFRYQMPSNDRLSFAAKLGVIDADIERQIAGNAARGSDSVNASPYYGVSAGWDINDSWRTVAGVEIFNLADSTDYWSVGFEFRFPNYSSK